MRITGWRVEGYGLLAGLVTEELPEGLSIVHGPNEAGKTTLLDFLRGVLFGFPDRRSRQAFHPPLRGGRHGGMVSLADDEGNRWAVERIVGAKAPVVTMPDGGLGDESDLKRLLGGADAGLFRSVFAFGLAELASLATLENDDVRDLLFSAGVLGAGRSATRAGRALEQRRNAIVRRRQQDALANRLRARLDDVEARLRVARSEASSYPERAAACARLADEVLTARRASEDTRRRAAELDRLTTCWPIWRRRVGELEALDGLGAPGEDELNILKHEPTIRHLAAERSGHGERLRRRDELAANRSGISRDVEEHLAELGGAMTLKTVRKLDLDLETFDRAGALVERYGRARAARDERRADVDRAAEEARRRASAWARASEGRAIRPTEMLNDLADALRELDGHRRERDRLLAKHAEAAHTATLERLAASRESTGGRSRGVAAALTAVAVGLVVAVVLAVRAQRTVLAGLAGACAAVLIVLAVLLWRRPSASQHGEEAFAGTTTGPEADLIERCEASIARLAVDLGLSGEPSDPEIARIESRLAAEREESERLDAIQREAREAAEHFDAVHARYEERREEILTIEREVDEEAQRLGLPLGLSAEGCLHALEHAREIRRLDVARRRVDTELASFAAATRTYEAEVADLLAVLGRLPDEDGPAPAVDETTGELEEELESALVRAKARAGHARAVADADEDLARALGSGPEADALSNELASGTLLAWNEERQAIAIVLDELTAEHERLFGAHRDAERALEELARSDEIATLELEAASLSSELEAALRHWAVLGIAQALLDRTLARYERDRQPAVVARAAELFAGVTGGRYVTIVAREDSENGKSHGIDAIALNGERVDAGALSRGTAEQLYLCLRLAFADSFASQSTSLPLVLDDVLVNFDPERAAAVARAVVETAAEHQVIAFTCHPHVVELFQSAEPSARIVELAR